MKTEVSTELREHMASDAATLAWAWVLKRQDGAVYGFTTCDFGSYVVSKIAGVPTITGQFAGSVYCVPAPGFIPTDIASTDAMSQDNLDIDALLDALGITEDDVRAKLWRAAELEICIYNYADLTMGTSTVFMGTLGGAVGGDISVKFEQRGITQILEANMEGIVGPMCGVALGSPLCGVNLATYRKTGTIQSPSEDRIFVDPTRTEADDWWTKGILTMTSGASNGTVVEVKHSLATGMIELVEELYYGFAAGDTYLITPGCNKLFEVQNADLTYGYTGDCIVKFSNGLNFQGEPEVPGTIAISQYGGQTVQ